MTPSAIRALVPALLAGILIASPASAQLSESELVTRLNRLENQVRQLTGTVEQLQYRNQQLEQQLGACAAERARRSARPLRSRNMRRRRAIRSSKPIRRNRNPIRSRT